MGFWKNKRVLITGHTGFKGSWLAILLNQLGGDVHGIALPAEKKPNLFEDAGLPDAINSMYCDLRDLDDLANHIEQVEPEIVFHLAAQPLVRASYQDPTTTFSTNVMGTVNLLDSLRNCDSVEAIIVVTTDKVYRNREWCWPYRESDPLGGHDPYSASKSACELIVDCYRASYFESRNVAVSTARAGNVIGGGDWADDRLIPDAIRAWGSGKPLALRRPDAVRPWQHVLEALRGYMMLAETMCKSQSYAGAYNFGPQSDDWRSVRDVVEMARAIYGSCEINYCKDVEGPQETQMLALDTSVAKSRLGFTPTWSVNFAIERTIRWYLLRESGLSAMDLCLRDIDEFSKNSKLT